MIFKNNKGQAMTKPFTVILILVLVAIISISMNQFGRDIASNPDNKLQDDSVWRIYNQSGFVPTEIKNSSTDSDDLFFKSDINTSGNSKDFALEFLLYQEQSSKIRTLIQDFWNLPSFFVSGLDLDGSAWFLVIQLWNTVIWAILFFVIYRVIRGLI